MIARLSRELAEAREAEQQLLHSSAQFAILVQSIKDYAIYMLDKTGRIISWNSGAERIKGYTSDALLHRLGSEVGASNKSPSSSVA